MNIQMRPILLSLLAVLLSLAANSLTWAQEVANPTKPTETAEKKPQDAKKPIYVRVTRDDQKKPLELQTSLVTFKSSAKEHEGVQVDLIGAVHIADKSYYDALNKQFESYDALLFELVAPKDTKPGKDRPARPGTAIGSLQSGMKDVLDLAFQLECIDYTKPNFIHADMSPDEFSASMDKRGESFAKMYFRAIGYGMARQDKGASVEASLLLSLFSKNRAQKMKVIMAEQMEDMDNQVLALEGPEGSTILTERNRKALEVLDRELKAGKKKIGIFYGAAHLADMETRLRDEFKFERTGETWLPAWNLLPKK